MAILAKKCDKDVSSVLVYSPDLRESMEGDE